MTNKLSRLNVHLIAVMVESVAALIWVGAIPGDRKTAFMFGLSPQRVLLMTIPFVMLILAGAALHFLILRPSHRTQQALGTEKFFAMRFLIPLSFWLGITSMAVMFLGETVLGFTSAAMERLTPILLLLFLVFCQMGILVQWSTRSSAATASGSDWRIILVFSGMVLLLAMAGIAAGLQHALSSPYASNTGIPLLPRQIVISLYAAVTYACLEKLLQNQRFGNLILPILAAILLLSLTVIIWLGVPIPENHFTHASNLGNGDFTLHSDALTYDINAQKMLLGNGLTGGQPLPRPLYSFFLGVIHAVVGPGVKAAIDAQTVVLALIPVLIFLLGLRLFSASAGVLAALLFIFREANQAALSGVYTLSSTRMLMTELFTALFLVGLALITLKWLKEPASRTRAIFTGSSLGITALIRTQVLALLPLLALWGLGALWNQRRQWPRAILWVGVGLLLVILPWMGRNAFRNGSFIFEDPAYSSRTLVVHDEQGETAGVLKSAAANPLEFLSHTISYIANNTTSSLNQFPWGGGMRDGLEEMIEVKPEPPFYPGSNSQPGQILVILIHLGLIVLGLTAAWQRSQWGGLFPIALYFGYAISSSLARYSGWRFILPVDWVILLYWALGVCAFLQLFGRTTGVETEPQALHLEKENSRERPLGIIMASALLLGLIVPIGETIYPKQIQLLDRTAILQKIWDSAPPRAVQPLVDDPSTLLAQGMLLYPVYLEDERAFNRLAVANPLVRSSKPMLRFIVLGDASPVVYLPLQNAPKGLSPGESVIAVGCIREEAFFAAGVFFDREKPRWLLSDQEIPDRCVGTASGN